MSKGLGIFDGLSEQDIRERANPGVTVHIDGKTESLAQGIHKAALQTVGRGVPTPMEAMKKEVGRLLAAFRDAEGRDPDPNADPEFWKAYSAILEVRTGGVTKDEGSTPVRKTSDEIADRITKALEDNTAPGWLEGLIERNR